MSWEGFAQVICQNGHYCRVDADCDECPICHAELAWINIVDDTNCESAGEIPQDLLDKHFLVTPAKIEICNLGHPHIIEHAIYRIPTKEESDPLQHWRPGYGGTPLVPY
jgi:hypothetical protein